MEELTRRLKMIQQFGKTIILSIILLFVLATASPCLATNVDIRGAPIDTGSTDSGNISWDYSTFPGMFFAANKYTQLVKGAGEHLYYQDDGGNPAIGSANPTANVIDEGELIYTTSKLASKYSVYSEEQNVTKVTKFYTISIFGTSYCAVDNDATTLAKILMKQDSSDKKTLKSGDKWEMKNGYSLVMNAVDIEGSKCYATLYKGDEELDTGVISTEATTDDRIYTVEQECADGSEHIYFLTYVDSIFAGQEDNFAVLKYTWLADKDSYTEIENGDEFGNFEVDEATESGLVLSNSNTITMTVSAGSSTAITGDWFFMSSDKKKGSNGGYVFYPVKRVVIEDTPTENAVTEETIEASEEDDEDTVIVDMSESEDDVDASTSNTDQPSPDDSVPDDSAVENSIPGFEGYIAILAISMLLFFRRNKL
jgi:S-layer protein (TIGR01567 family)